MRHESLPMTMTPEQLADYIRSNRIETKNHIEKIMLTEEEKRDLAVKSSLASRQIVKLENLKKDFTKLITKGTPWNNSLGDGGDNIPVPITIPPTKGLDALKSNRLFHDEQIEKGYREDVTAVYLLPWPEYEKIVAVDIEGNEWSKYSRPMTKSEIAQHGKPILSASTEIKDVLAEQGIEIERVDGKEVKLTQNKEKKGNRKRNLLAEDDGDGREDMDSEQPI